MKGKIYRRGDFFGSDMLIQPKRSYEAITIIFTAVFSLKKDDLMEVLFRWGDSPPRSGGVARISPPTRIELGTRR